MNSITRSLFYLVILINSISSLQSQPNDLMITYDANQGVTGLVGANKVYMYSGAVTSGPSGQWEWITGSVNLDDGVGQMTPLGSNLWTICIDPAVYYGTALPILAIDIIFRNENGSAYGYDFNGTYTILDMTTPSPTSTFSGVTTGYCGVGFAENETQFFNVLNYPNPFQNETTFIYKLPSGSENAFIKIYETSGKCVATFILNASSSGIQKQIWKETIGAGIYFYSLEVNGKVKQTHKMIVTGK